MYLDEQDLVPYAALNYLVAEANYGGRVTDDKDVRLIRAMLRKYFCPEVMNDSYKLSKLDAYYAPPEGPLADARAYIETLPQEEDPEVFGLHPNANLAYEVATANLLASTVLAMQPRLAGGGAGLTPDQLAQNLSRDIAAKMPALLDNEKAHPTTFGFSDRGQPLSLGVFVGQEIDRFNALLAVMKHTLVQLDKAIQGTVVMSAALEAMARAFNDDKVPSQWEGVGYPSLKPLSSWIPDLLLRVDFLAKWLYEGPPATYWLPAFFFPQGFMTAAMQTYARKTATAIDTLQFRSHVCAGFADSITEGPEDGVNIHGLFLEGCAWSASRGTLEDSAPKVPIAEFPVLWLQPVDITENLTQGCFECPLYKTSLRRGELSTTGHSTNFVCFTHLPTEGDANHWLRRGAALLCMTDN